MLKKRKIIILCLLALVIFSDFLFFDYDISDLKSLKVDATDLYNKIEGGVEADLPFLFEDLGFYIRDCKEYFKYKPKATNAFEKDVLRDIDKKCNFLKYLRNAKIASNSFVDYVDLRQLNAWDKELFFKYTCEKNDNYKEFISKYENVKTMVDDGVLETRLVEPNRLIVYNKFLNKTFQIRELFRANFDDTSKTKDILLEVSVADAGGNYVECTKYVAYTRNAENSLMSEEGVVFRKSKVRN